METGKRRFHLNLGVNMVESGRECIEFWVATVTTLELDCQRVK